MWASDEEQEQPVIVDKIRVEGEDDAIDEGYLYYDRVKSAIKKLKKQDEVDMYLEMALMED